MNQKVIVALVLTALVAAAALYNLEETSVEPQGDNALDTTCGFTDDFATFIKNNGKDSPI
jgi:hypothetical protein